MLQGQFVFQNKNKLLKIFSPILGHIAVATTNINKNNTGKIDKRARKFLSKI